jgi:putative acetyltransferase
MLDRAVVRQEHPGDESGVRRVNELAFGRDAEARLVDALREVPGAFSLVAVTDGHIAGHIMFSPIQVEGSPDASGLALAPMAVLPDVQRQGIGSELVRAGLAECRARGIGFVVVLGHPEFYPRFGFVTAAGRGLSCEYPVAPEVFMVFELRPSALEGVGGLVKYDRAFATV